ncbi:polysaccharide pyruvyl transferase family protein [Rathayibacter sp. VKM Ac-2927]|uniref:polysaccharide pyruvyl transferase family protein n=1 Tax=Rathayibacter sp. VKM Ac-2927 TaxID=2929478 RepID=UPI001FB4B54C|nr:polysaccharide pyruvyl transferase family protein [Rathayibacter sp. VKM Ac-2927]MCJ1687801.1 polysaccharide pyruvyl transferase family protein [Rathayibacter sp. VKM Ac-2927]
MTMDYAPTMLERTKDALHLLHGDASRLHFTDFPDYANIGDSAIAQGQYRYWHWRKLDILSTSSFHTMPPRLYSATDPVYINGGGNFGGLYKEHSEHRYSLAERLPAETMLIQGPQSIHWASPADRDEFMRRMAPRKQLRIAVRDHASYDDLKDDVEGLILSPDAVHMLGRVPAPEPTQKEVRLIRRDPESAGGLGEGIDWPKDQPVTRASAWLTHRTKELPFLRSAIPTANGLWEPRSRRRLATGLALLAQGETVVTDRLHGMLIALQLGRPVKVRDNKIGKLHKYVDTWLADTDADITWV